MTMSSTLRKMRSLSTTDHILHNTNVDDMQTDGIGIDIDTQTDIIDLPSSLNSTTGIPRPTGRKSQSLSRLDVLRVQVMKAEQQQQTSNTKCGTDMTPAPVTKVPLLWNVKGRAALLRTWMASNPLVSSVFEELDKNLARQTRQNTLHNRHSLKLQGGHRRVNTWGTFKQKCVSEGEGCSSSSSTSSMQSILFSDTVHAFYYNGEDTEAQKQEKERQQRDKNNNNNNNGSDIDDGEDEDNSSSAFIRETVPLKKPNKIPPLEVRRARARNNYPTDPSSPVSRGGQWMSKQR